MSCFIGVALLLLAHSLFAEPADPPRGHWRNMDIRSVEVLQDGTCIRLWLEERTYDLVPQGTTRLTGTYTNTIRATPVGLPSLRPECKFPAPADKPLSMQIRGWSLVGTLNPNGSWRIRAESAMGTGNMQAFKTKDFQTVLTRSGSSLIDGEGEPNDPNRVLVFRASEPTPAAARSLLEETLRTLHTGACLEVASRFAPSPDAARQACALRQRMSAFSGNYLSIAVDTAEEFDRVPVGFPKLPSSSFLRQRGVFFGFIARYEKQQIPCNAVLVEEGDGWSVDVLWC